MSYGLGQLPGQKVWSCWNGGRRLTGRRQVWATEAQKRYGFVLKMFYDLTTEGTSPVSS